jgi:hypothetical protein
MATITVDFDANPRTVYIPAGTHAHIRFVDKSTTDNGVINSWLWEYDESGWATFSTTREAIFERGAGTYNIRLTCNDTGSTGATSLIKTAFVVVEEGAYTPPLQNTAYRNITLFVYEQDVASPKSACICRSVSPSCNLYYTDLKIQGAMTKPGKATFTIVNPGAGTADEVDLFESEVNGKYKNIAIICGYDVAWSGKITKSVKTNKSQPGSTTQKAIYTVEAYTDIKKLADWNILTAEEVTAKTPGLVLESILAVNSGEPDFKGTGYNRGYIDTSGARMQMSLGDTDKYTAFTALVNACDYDWRTRMDTRVYSFAGYQTGAITVSGAALSANELVGQWLLYPTDTYVDAALQTVPNQYGIISWGLITSNTADTITCSTMHGGGSIREATTDLETCLVLNVPRIDYSSDIAEIDPVRTFANNTRGITQFADLDEKYDLFTKVVSKGTINQSDGTPRTQSLSLAAKDLWNDTDRQFENTTYLSYQSDARVYASPTGQTYVYTYREGIWKAGDVVVAVIFDTLAGTYSTKQLTIVSVTDYYGSDGSANQIPTYEMIFNTWVISAFEKVVVYIVNLRLYLDDPTRVTQAGTYTYLTVGAEISTRKFTNALTGTDAVYGAYMQMGDATAFTKEDVYSHKAGCLVSNNTYTEAAPQAGSPIDTYGVITKPISIGATSNYADLEVTATHALIQGSQYYQKSTILLSYYQFSQNRVRDSPQLTLPAMIREGQLIGITPYTGASTIYRQVILWDLDTRTMVVTLTLGDFVKDVFSVISSTTAATQKKLI